MVFFAVIFVVVPVAAGALAITLIRKYREYKWGHCTSKKSLSGQICLVTGANSGIGKEVAKDFASRKAKVILACRDMASARKAIEDIRKTVSTGELIPMHVDLASLESVRKFAAEVLRDFPQINILVNNAGVWINENKAKTEDGFEIHFGVNHLSHFLLTNLLQKRLQESKPSRVVTVSSLLHEKGKIDFENLNFEKTDGEVPKGRMNAGYCNSKLANALFSQHLAVKAPLETGVSTYAVCPGLTMTGLFRSYKIKFYHYILFSPVILWHLRTPNQGAQTVIHCAVSDEVEGVTGGFYQNCKPYTSKADLNPQLAKDLWEVSERLVGIKQ